MNQRESEVIQSLVRTHSTNELLAMMSQDYPASSFRLLSGGEIWWPDVIRAAKARDAEAK